MSPLASETSLVGSYVTLFTMIWMNDKYEWKGNCFEINSRNDRISRKTWKIPTSSTTEIRTNITVALDSWAVGSMITFMIPTSANLRVSPLCLLNFRLVSVPYLNPVGIHAGVFPIHLATFPAKKRFKFFLLSIHYIL